MYGYLCYFVNFVCIVEVGLMKLVLDVFGIVLLGLSDLVKVLEGCFGMVFLICYKVGVILIIEGEWVYVLVVGIVDKMNEVLGLENNLDLIGGCRISVLIEVVGICFGLVVYFFCD